MAGSVVVVILLALDQDGNDVLDCKENHDSLLERGLGRHHDFHTIVTAHAFVELEPPNFVLLVIVDLKEHEPVSVVATLGYDPKLRAIVHTNDVRCQSGAPLNQQLPQALLP